MAQVCKRSWLRAIQRRKGLQACNILTQTMLTMNIKCCSVCDMRVLISQDAKITLFSASSDAGLLILWCPVDVGHAKI